MHERTFYDKSSIEKISEAFKRYSRSYRNEIIDSKGSLVQLEASKLSIEYLFKDLLDKVKGFKCQIKIKILLRKHKENRDVESAPVYFNSFTN